MKLPYATDDYRLGNTQMFRQRALTKRYIQVNPPGLLPRMVIDVDHPDTVLRALNPALPRPSWIAESPSGRAHVGYRLAVPVNLTNQKSLLYVAAVEEALRRSLGGDPAYPSHLTKNPLHTDWETWWPSDETHTLDSMAAQLAGFMPSRGEWTRAGGYRPDIAGLGRNCGIFETVRIWAYRGIRGYWEDGIEAYRTAVADQVMLANVTMPVPLHETELRGITNSITRWTWGEFTPEKFRKIQKARSVKGNAVKTARAIEQEHKVMRMREEGWKWQDIADTLGMPLGAAQKVGRRARDRAQKPTLPVSEPSPSVPLLSL